MEEEEYVEVPTEEENYEDDEFTLGDFFFLTFLVVLACAVFSFVVKTISKHLKNVKLKVGAVEVGVETKEKSDEKKPEVKKPEEKKE